MYTFTLTKWMLRQRKGDSSYNEQLAILKLLPLCYNREVRDLIFFYKTLYGMTEHDVHQYVSFVPNNLTRPSHNPNLTFKTPRCNTSTYHASYFNGIVELWNYVCRSATFSSLRTFKNFLLTRYTKLTCSVLFVHVCCHVRGQCHVNILVIKVEFLTCLNYCLVIYCVCIRP